MLGIEMPPKVVFALTLKQMQPTVAVVQPSRVKSAYQCSAVVRAIDLNQLSGS